MGARRLRKAKYTAPQQSKVHDRTSAVIPLNAKFFVDEIDDPYGRREYATLNDRGELCATIEKVTAIRSTRDDPLASLKHQGVIDGVQFLAGQMFQWSYIRSELGPLRAIDPTREGVDGGRLSEPLNDQVKRAVDLQNKARQALGHDGQSLMIDVVGKGMTLAKASDARGLTTKSGREYIGRRFRECLDRLAIVFGCATPSVPQATSR